MSIKDNIAKLSREQGLSITQLEKMCGMSKSTILKWDDHSPSVDKLLKVAAVLHVTVDDILGIKKEAAESDLSDLQIEAVNVIKNLPPEKTQRVLDFLAGLKG